MLPIVFCFGRLRDEVEGESGITGLIITKRFLPWTMSKRKKSGVNQETAQLIHEFKRFSEQHPYPPYYLHFLDFFINSKGIWKKESNRFSSWRVRRSVASLVNIMSTEGHYDFLCLFVDRDFSFCVFDLSNTTTTTLRPPPSSSPGKNVEKTCFLWKCKHGQ